MTPEEKAREAIDQQLEACGWRVQNYREMDLSAGVGIAVREFPLTSGEADYLLYTDGRAIGVVEAKPEGHTLTGVETQSAKYTTGLPHGLPNYRLLLPFSYEFTGSETRFTNILEPDARSRPVFTFHRPEELIRLVELEAQVRALLRTMPPLESCTIITTPPNGLASRFHDRMPVILHPDDFHAWLKGDDIPLVSFAAHRMSAKPVSTFVNSVKNQGPECLAPR
jgi:hypothetical protein